VVATCNLLDPPARLLNQSALQAALSSVNFTQTPQGVTSPLSGVPFSPPVFTLIQPTPAPSSNQPTPTPSSAPSSLDFFNSEGFIPTLVMGWSIVVVAGGGTLIIIVIVILSCCCCPCCACCPKRKRAEARAKVSLPTSQLSLAEVDMALRGSLSDRPAESARLEELEERPLPPGWKKCQVQVDDGHPEDHVGHTYYFNQYTGWSEWDLVAVFAHPVLDFDIGQIPQLPPPPLDSGGSFSEKSGGSFSVPAIIEIEDDPHSKSLQQPQQQQQFYAFSRPESPVSNNFAFMKPDVQDASQLCQRPGCSNFLALRCPTCLSLGLPDFSICSQECLALAWPDHSAATEGH